MGLLDKIKSTLETEDDRQPDRKIVIEPEEAPEMVKDAYAGQIETAKEHEEELIDETDELLNQLENNLEEVEEYEDVEGIKAAEDIAQSFYNSRKIMIENFNPDKDTESYENALEDFLSEFNDVDRKEKALMERMKTDVVGIAETVQKLGDKLEEIKEFNEKGKKMLYDIDNLEKEVNQYNETVNMIGEKKNQVQKQEEEIQQLEELLSQKKDELDDLKETEEWEEKEEIEEEIQSVKSDIKDLENKLSSSASNLERGLKKLIYQVENQGMNFSGKIENLKKLKEEGFNDLEPVEDDLEEARTKIREEELLSGRQLEEFEDEVENHPEYTSEIEELSELRARKEDLEEELENAEALKKKKKLKNKIQEVKNKIESQQEKLETLEDDLEDLKQEKKSLKSSIKDDTEELMNEPVEFKNTAA